MTLQFPDLDRRGVDDYEDDRDGDDGMMIMMVMVMVMIYYFYNDC